MEPHFTYCSIVWGECSETLKDRLQTLQNKAARTIVQVSCDEANHSKLLAGWLSIRNLIKLDMGVFAYKELNNLHPEQDISPFQELDDQRTYTTSTVTNNNLFIPRGTYLFLEILIYSFLIGPCHTQEANCGMKFHMRSEGYKYLKTSKINRRHIWLHSRPSQHDTHWFLQCSILLILFPLISTIATS